MKTAKTDRVSPLKKEEKSYRTLSGLPVQAVYGPDDLRGWDPVRDLGKPGSYPFTRGVHPDMYRGKPWTIRQFSGFGTAQETNKRFKFLLEGGQTGLSVAFDLPTLMGLDSDHRLSEGEVGKCGVAVDSLRDMEVLFDGIRLDQVTTSMTINAPAVVLMAMYFVVAEKQGIDLARIRGTAQNDILKEYIAQKEWIYPPQPSMRLVADSIEFCSQNLPKYNPISISGYHIREAGSTAVQELAFTLRDGIEYVEWCQRRGMDVDSFAPRLSFFFNAHNDFFEEIAKFRAARRLWAHTMKERFRAKDPRSWMCRFHTQTAGCSLTAQQPMNNIIRTTLQALAGVLGGTNSLHTNSLDEAWALPTQEAALIAVRTQQIIQHESQVVNTVDPLGGSYFVESLTNRVEEAAKEYVVKIDSMGGMVPAIEQGFPQKEIQDASYQYQRAVEDLDEIIVGVNRHTGEDEQKQDLLKIGPEVWDYQKNQLHALKSERSDPDVARQLQELKNKAGKDENLMPAIMEAVRCYATVGEICDTLTEVFGCYEEPFI